jgi:putative tryptophan/tyrosine transport system substrate-binding protein
VKVLFSGGTPATLAAKVATTTIPIVFENGIDPVGLGLVQTLSRPGGNVTGVTNMSTTLAAKRLALLHQLVPKAATIAIPIDLTAAASDTQRIELQKAADALGLQLLFLNAGNDQEIDAAFATLARQQIGALLLTDNPTLNFRREQLVTSARLNAIPTMCVFRDFAEAGGLISYAASLTDAGRPQPAAGPDLLARKDHRITSPWLIRPTIMLAQNPCAMSNVCDTPSTPTLASIAKARCCSAVRLIAVLLASCPHS